MQRNDKILFSFLAAVTVAIILSVALTNKAKSQPAPPDRPFTVTLPLSQWQVVANALQDRPFKEVAGVLQAIQQQISTAEAQPPKPPAPVEPEPKK